MSSPDAIDQHIDRTPDSIDHLEANRSSTNPRRQRYMEQMQASFPSQAHRHPRRTFFLSYTAWIASILAPVTYLAGLIANEDGNWRTAFFMLFSTWLIVIGIGVLIDLSNRNQVELIKRPLWHAGCCLLIMFIIVSTVEPPPEQVPQWIPVIIDLGLGISIGLQELPPDTRKRVFGYVTDLLGSIYGCICPNSRSRSVGT